MDRRATRMKAQTRKQTGFEIENRGTWIREGGNCRRHGSESTEVFLPFQCEIEHKAEQSWGFGGLDTIWADLIRGTGFDSVRLIRPLQFKYWAL